MVIREALGQEDIDQVFAIRTQVFVAEQKCLPSEEFDELDAQARHFLLELNGLAVATGRYRRTEKGIKIERIATLADFRGNGYASFMVKHLIQMAKLLHPLVKHFYLHAQQNVMPLYASLGFNPYGQTFVEADIVHQAMQMDFN